MEKLTSHQYKLVRMIIICLLFLQQAKSQFAIGDSIKLLVNANREECPGGTNESSEQCDFRWHYASKYLDSYYFVKDSSLLNYIDSFEHYLTRKYRPYRYSTGSERYMEDQIAAFRLSYRMSDYPSQMQLDSSIHYRSHILLKYLSDKLPVNQVTESYKSHTDVEYRVLLFGGLIRKFDKTKIPEVYYKLIDTLLIDRTDYRMVIKLLRDCRIPECDSLFNLEYQRFDTLKDLNNDFDKSLWEDIFNRGDEIRDSLEKIEMYKDIQRRDDSIRNAMLELENAPFDEALYLSTLDSTNKVYYYAQKDTTLWYNGTIFTGDDGTNFNTWSNDSLLIKLRSLHPDSLYNTCNKKLAQMNGSIPVFHLRKICQIIGDRILNGSLVLSSDDSLFLHQLVEYYAAQYADTLNYRHHFDLTEESKAQLLRLWPLLPAHIISWIERPEFMYHALAAGMLVCIFNEDLVNALIYKMDHPANATEVAMKRSYFDMLELLYFYKEPSAESHGIFLPPRRPLRNYQQTQDWIDRLIEPARIRHGISEVK